MVAPFKTGLWRLECFPPMHRANWNRTSGAVPQQQAERDLARLERRNRMKYRLQKASFVIGIIALTSARLFYNIAQYY